MSEENKNALSVLETEVTDIIDQAIQETDPSKVKDLTNLFNMSINKKNMVRVKKFSDLLDKIEEQAEKRFESAPDNFSNKEVLDYLTAVSNIHDKAVTNLKNIEAITPVQLNQQNNQYNINIGESEKSISLSLESRNRITDAVNAILASVENKALEQVEIVEDSEDEDE